MQEKVAKVFRQNYQIKRVLTQISDLRTLRQKGSFDLTMSLLKSEGIIFKIKTLEQAFKNFKIKPSPCQFKIIIRSDYPAIPPNLYFMHEDMINMKILPFRNYLTSVLVASNLYSPSSTPSERWTPKITLANIIKSVPIFIEKILEESQGTEEAMLNQPISLNEYFQIDAFCSWKFCQVHPISLIRNKKLTGGFLVVNQNMKELVFLYDCSLQSSYQTCDYLQASQILSMRKKKKNSNHILIEAKFKGLKNQINGRFCIEFITQDYDTILLTIMELIQGQTNKQLKQNNASSESQSESSQSNEQPESININEILETIVVYESMVDNQMTSENINQLVILLQKAIEYYSALSDPRFKVYLEKMQNILSNQMAQVLLESAGDGKNKENKKGFQSIVDLI